jgi:hypothetical protein
VLFGAFWKGDMTSVVNGKVIDVRSGRITICKTFMVRDSIFSSAFASGCQAGRAYIMRRCPSQGCWVSGKLAANSHRYDPSIISAPLSTADNSHCCARA